VNTKLVQEVCRDLDLQSDLVGGGEPREPEPVSPAPMLPEPVGSNRLITFASGTAASDLPAAEEPTLLEDDARPRWRRFSIFQRRTAG
jgi:hypothetical protein